MMLGGEDVLEDDFQDLNEQNDAGEGGEGGGCDMPPPPPPQYDDYLQEIGGRMEETPLLDMDLDEDTDDTQPELENGTGSRQRTS